MVLKTMVSVLLLVREKKGLSNPFFLQGRNPL
nr:MAG TPA: hypothetical protein [Bacteriophage sp.]DAZ69325.1 MAG TPA: hypothetical protein [Caudoviricetes sp.]